MRMFQSSDSFRWYAYSVSPFAQVSIATNSLLLVIKYRQYTSIYNTANSMSYQMLVTVGNELWLTIVYDHRSNSNPSV